jgi:hypothetical protein
MKPQHAQHFKVMIRLGFWAMAEAIVVPSLVINTYIVLERENNDPPIANWGGLVRFRPEFGVVQPKSVDEVAHLLTSTRFSVKVVRVLTNLERPLPWLWILGITMAGGNGAFLV